MAQKSTNKLWGGRFNAQTNKLMETVNSSIEVDKRLYAEDIFGSQKYAKALQNAGLLSTNETSEIIDGLDKIKIQWENGLIEIEKGDEDIHTANERLLKEQIGISATKLHVGRSRNDQVITDMKLWLRSSIDQLSDVIQNCIKVIIQRSSSEIDILMPGYTHLQRAQPVRWSHWLLSHGWNLKEDVDRLLEIRTRVNKSPLGSGAISGNPFNIDRKELANELGFSSITYNSMQAVGDRDFIAEFLFWASLCGIHLTRLAEDLILFSSQEFSFVKISDEYSTGSSLMPQKRNPDSLELIRGISAGLFGQCCGFMMTIKGLPSTYNKDFQSDKESVFTTFDKLLLTLELTQNVVKTLKVDIKKCKSALSEDMLATDVAYYLVKKGVPFREAHHITGKVVALAEEKNVSISQLSLPKLKNISNIFNDDYTQIWNYETSVEQYKAIGGTSRSNIKHQIGILEDWIKKILKEKM